MTPILISMMKAKMRLAFTQACRNFPKIDVIPIMRAVYEAYAFEAYSQGNTFTMADNRLADEVDELSKEACKKLLASDEFQRITYGLSPGDKKLASSCCRGLDYLTGLQILEHSRKSKTRSSVEARRKMALEIRRNQLANSFVEIVLEKAVDRIRNADRGWSYYAESRTG